MDDNSKLALLQLVKTALDKVESSSDEEDDLITEQELLFGSSSSSEDDVEVLRSAARVLFLGELRGPLIKRPRIEGFVDNVVPRYSDEEFKSHFRFVPTVIRYTSACHQPVYGLADNVFSFIYLGRLYPATFEFVLELLEPRLNREGARGRLRIPSRTQLLMALWMMATPDCYRY